MEDMNDGWSDEEGDMNADVGDGWGDDELDMLDDDDELAALDEDYKPAVGNSIIVDEGWDWNDDDENIDIGVDEADNDIHERNLSTGVKGAEAVKAPTPDLHLYNSAAPPDIAEQKLLEYINALDDISLLESLNEELDVKRNNPETALELCRYYHDRENLREYTLDTEVPRMNYHIMISDELILTEANEVQQHFLENPVDNLVDDMLLRCSNQSLLADVFPIITGPQKIIRMQFHANAVATQCKLVLDMRNMRSVQVDCTMTVSIPSGMPAPATKLDLATLRLLIQFSPEPSAPRVRYQLLALQPVLNTVRDREQIRTAAKAMDIHQIEEMEQMMASRTNKNADTLRDNFLNSVTSTQTGLKTALREIDGVVNVKSKLNYLASALPVLPSADEIMMAEHQHQPESRENSQRAFPVPMSMRMPTPPPPPPPPSRANSNQEANNPNVQRPKPIIGGLLISGISRLAKAATIPEEADAPVLYRKDNARTPPPPPPRAQVPASLPTPANIPPFPPAHDRSVPSMGNTTSIGGEIAYNSASLKATSDNVQGFDNDDNDALLDGISGGGWSDDGLDDDLDVDLDNDQEEDDELAAIAAIDVKTCARGDTFNDSSLKRGNNAFTAGIKQDKPAPRGKETVISGSLGVRDTATVAKNIPKALRSDIQNTNTKDAAEVVHVNEKSTTITIPQEQSTTGKKGLSDELKAERDYLLQKLSEIHQIKNGTELVLTDSNCDGSTGIIPTRKRFVSRAEILNLQLMQKI